MPAAASTSAARTTKSRGSAAARKPRARRTVKAAQRAADNGKQSQTAAASADSPKETVEESHTHSGQDSGLLGLGELALAMVLGALGFVVHLFWIGALVVMAVMLGSMVAQRQGNPRRGGGVVSEVVAAVVDEVREIADSASGSPADDGESKTTRTRPA